MEFLIFKTAGINRAFLWVLSAADLNIPVSRRGHGHAWPRNGRQLRFSVKLFLEVHSTSDKEETPVFPPVLSWPWVTAPIASRLSMSELCVHLLQLREVRVFPCYSVVPPEISVHVPSGLGRCSCCKATLFPGSPGSCLALGSASPGPSPARSRRALPWEGAQDEPQPQRCSRRRGEPGVPKLVGPGRAGRPGAARSPPQATKARLCAHGRLCSLQVPCWVSATASCTVSLE